MVFRQTVSGTDLDSVFMKIPQSLRNRLVEVTIQPVDIEEEMINYSCRVGFLHLPQLPDSFFDPLPEEELQAWGL